MKNTIIILGIIAFASIFFAINSKRAVKWTISLFVILIAILAVDTVFPGLLGN